MRARIALFVILAVGIISAAQLVSALLTTSPYTASPADLRLFFVSLYLCLTVVLGFVLYGLRQLRARRTGALPLWPSFRQAGLVSVVLVLSIFFNTLGIFQFWDVIPLALAAVLIEFFFQAEKKPHATITYDPEG